MIEQIYIRSPLPLTLLIFCALRFEFGRPAVDYISSQPVWGILLTAVCARRPTFHMCSVEDSEFMISQAG